ncbi:MULTISPECIES: DUF1269 domain-containing protein [Enterococcus]|uniref:DUF1269 domain-containing protein n=1 Tax=Enterococcus thailandicus TaxID=417368 RepID=A0A179ETL9_ENTTH|nr:DUF1269 domain-containing protein [Enterococcus thailandicus]OAQ56556.1 DUF1269 domain-containing protein [Enterococcus thailandicus]
MNKRVIILNFDVESQAYQAFSEIKKFHATRKIKGEQMAVISHDPNGTHQFKVEDFIDFTGSNKSSKGGMIGMLVGILGGPLGILLGWFAGGMIGATQDAKEIQNAQTVFDFVGDKIGEGATGLILIAEEEDNRPLNQLVMMELGGEITRLDYDDVEKDVADAKEVERSTKEAAQKTWSEKHPPVENQSKDDENEQE